MNTVAEELLPHEVNAIERAILKAECSRSETITISTRHARILMGLDTAGQVAELQERVGELEDDAVEFDEDERGEVIADLRKAATAIGEIRTAISGEFDADDRRRALDAISDVEEAIESARDAIPA